MSTNKLFNHIAEIETRVCQLQQAHVALQEQLTQTQNDFERNIDESALRLIDILDLITIMLDNNDGTAANGHLVLNKISKRIVEVLRRWQVQEITFSTGRIETGKARVVETRTASSETQPGTIIEVCRKGYHRGTKIIRPSDVITAG